MTGKIKNGIPESGNDILGSLSPVLLKVGLLLAIIFIVANQVHGQQTIPDGTEGEMLEVVKSDTVLHEKWRDKRWRLFPGKYSTLKIGGGFLYEFAGYSQNQAAKQQMDSLDQVLEPAFDVRDFRIVVSGQLKTKRIVSWKAGFMYNGDTKEWLVRETGLMVNVPELWGNIFIGRTKEGFSLNKVMNGYAGWTMERQMALDVIPILADGVKWMAYLPKKRVFWNLGIFTDWLSKSQSFSTFKWQFISRIGYLPIYDQDEKKLLHVGLNFRYGEPANGEIQMRSRPETNPAPFFLSTGKFQTNQSNHMGYEIYYSQGPWMFGSEYYVHRFNSTSANNPVFYGGEVVASYMFTGESRPYNTSTSIYGFVPVNKPVFKGGPGAWEALIRFSTLDLDAGNLKGGKFWRITPMVNWYLSKDVRFGLAYGYGVLDRYNLKGATHFFQSRLQLTLL